MKQKGMKGTSKALDVSSLLNQQILTLMYYSVCEGVLKIWGACPHIWAAPAPNFHRPDRMSHVGRTPIYNQEVEDRIQIPIVVESQLARGTFRTKSHARYHVCKPILVHTFMRGMSCKREPREETCFHSGLINQPQP